MKNCIDCNKPIIGLKTDKCNGCSHKGIKQNRIKTTEQCFWEKIDKNGPIVEYVGTPCWIWIGAKTGDGYGAIKEKRKQIPAHKYSYQLHYGDNIPENIFVCHKCDNKSCVNPDHLFLGTHSQNMLDMYAKGRCPINNLYDYHFNGEKHHMAKLTEQQVREIKQLYQTGMRQSMIADKFNTPRKTINNIVHGRTRKNS